MTTLSNASEDGKRQAGFDAPGMMNPSLTDVMDIVSPQCQLCSP